MRTSTSRTFLAAEPGRYETHYFASDVAGPPGPDGRRRLLDDAFVDDAADGYEADLGVATVRVPAVAGSGRSVVELSFTSGERVGFSLQQSAAVPAHERSAPSAKVHAIEFPGLRDRVDLQLELVAGGVKETLVLESRDAGVQFVFPLELDGAVASIDPASGDVIFASESAGGAPIARMPRGWMADSAYGAPGTDPTLHYSEGVRYELVATATGHDLVVTLDRAWLDSPERVWPVSVDPTLVTWNAGADDTFVTPYVNTDRSTSPFVVSGSQGLFRNIAYVHVDADVSGKQIHYAGFKASQTDGATCNVRATSLHRVTAPWNGVNLTWSTRPAFETAPLAQATSAVRAGSADCGAADWAEWDVTGTVAQWADGVSTNHGFALVPPPPSELDPEHWRKWEASDVGPRGPHLVVTWSPPAAPGAPDTPSNLAPSGDLANLAPSASASYTDPDGDPGFNLFVVRDAATRELVYWTTGALVASGTASTATIPPRQLLPEVAYELDVTSVEDKDGDGGLSEPDEPASATATTAFEVRDLQVAGRPASPTGLDPQGVAQVGMGQHGEEVLDVHDIYSSTQGHEGHLVFRVRDAEDRVVGSAWGGRVTGLTGGASSASVVLLAALRAGEVYEMTAWSVDEVTGLVSTPTVVTFEAAPATFARPGKAEVVFAQERLELDTAANWDTVTFTVDGDQLAVDVDGTDGWAVEWDTTTAPDGEHTLAATGVLAGSFADATADVVVLVDNSMTSPQRVQVDRDRQLISLDEWALFLYLAGLRHPDLPARYSPPSPDAPRPPAEEGSSPDDTLLISAVQREWDLLSPATRDLIEWYRPTVVAYAPPPGSGHSGACVDQVTWTWGDEEVRTCAYSASSSGPDPVTVRVSYDENFEDPGVLPHLYKVDVNGNDVPDQVEAIAEVALAAIADFEAAGYGRPFDGDRLEIQIVHYPVNGGGSDQQCGFAHRYGGYIEVGGNSEASCIAHEVFHTVIFDREDAIGGSEEWVWFGESTAQWAPNYYSAQPGSALGDLATNSDVPQDWLPGDGDFNPNLSWERGFYESLDQFPTNRNLLEEPDLGGVVSRFDNSSGYRDAAFWAYLSQHHSAPSPGHTTDDLVHDLYHQEPLTEPNWRIGDVVTAETGRSAADLVVGYWMSLYHLSPQSVMAPYDDYAWTQPGFDADGMAERMHTRGIGRGRDAFGDKRLDESGSYVLTADEHRTIDVLGTRASGARFFEIGFDNTTDGVLTIDARRLGAADTGERLDGVRLVAAPYSPSGHPQFCQRIPGDPASADIRVWDPVDEVVSIPVDGNCDHLAVMVVNGSSLSAKQGVRIKGQIDVEFVASGDRQACITQHLRAMFGSQVSYLAPGECVAVNIPGDYYADRTETYCVWFSLRAPAWPSGDPEGTFTVSLNGVSLWGNLVEPGRLYYFWVPVEADSGRVPVEVAIDPVNPTSNGHWSLRGVRQLYGEQSCDWTLFS